MTHPNLGNWVQGSRVTPHRWRWPRESGSTPSRQNPRQLSDPCPPVSPVTKPSACQFRSPHRQLGPCREMDVGSPRSVVRPGTSMIKLRWSQHQPAPCKASRRQTTSPRMAPSSRGLGHHPLKVETRVRIPLGLPRRCTHQSRSDLLFRLPPRYLSVPAAPPFARCLMHG